VKLSEMDRIALLEAALADVEYDISKLEKTKKRMEKDIEELRRLR
jgi:hypothetical protein